MTTFTPDQWIILGLVFVLGLLIGMWMTSGGRRKWKTRYNEEVERRRTLEREMKDRETHWATRETEWRETDSLRTAATREPVREERWVEVRDDEVSRPRDADRDGVPNRDDRRPLDDRRY